ncbi:hypothetical protein VKT23_019528 [Stygiomarasmius scandens]|uniref:Uncharacterized protein n=1 Tax=Marasmiellus scandens TaxID=2682957 RepID=A0ABR1IL56_9AGAR
MQARSNKLTYFPEELSRAPSFPPLLPSSTTIMHSNPRATRLQMIVKYLSLTLFLSTIQNVRAAASGNANCSSGFSWAGNTRGDSPCALSAAVLAPCNKTGTQIVPPLSFGHDSYDPATLSGGAVSKCYCTWATYNLLSACAACQSFSSAVTTWSFFIRECDGNLSANTYYPSGLVSDDNTEIPFYASVNPQTWTAMTFDVHQAKSITDQGHADLSLKNPSDASPANATALLLPASSSTSSGSGSDFRTSLSTKAIIGITIGGLVAVSVVGAVVRRRYSSGEVVAVQPAPVVETWTSERHTRIVTQRW